MKELYNKISDDKKRDITEFLKNIESNISLPYKDKKLFIQDFENAITYYYNKRYSLEKIFDLLNINNIGACYNESATDWFFLDNSAKIYPLSMKENWMSVFRVSYYLNENVVPEILQMALNFTMKRFPTFRTSVRKGFFWHYLDGIKKRFKVHCEKESPCSFINVSSIGKQSFKVVYYKNRISVEYFHILTDGYGGTVFLSTLTSEYFRLLGRKQTYNDIVLDVNKKYYKEETYDEFLNLEKSNNSRSLGESRALEIDGKLSKVGLCQVIHFDINKNDLIKLAKSKNVTITNLMLGFIFMVCSQTISKDGFINIQVPVNMRKYYKSKTLRNFSLYVVISIKKSDINDFDSLLFVIKNQMEEKINKKYFDEVATYTSKLVNSIRLIPLIIKRPIAKMIYGYLGDKVLTTVFSNLGEVKIPKSLSSNVNKMDMILGTGITNKVLFSMITCNDIVTFTITKYTTNSSVENLLYNMMINEGLKVNVHGSDVYENKK